MKSPTLTLFLILLFSGSVYAQMPFPFSRAEEDLRGPVASMWYGKQSVKLNRERIVPVEWDLKYKNYYNEEGFLTETVRYAKKNKEEIDERKIYSYEGDPVECIRVSGNTGESTVLLEWDGSRLSSTKTYRGNRPNHANLYESRGDTLIQFLYMPNSETPLTTHKKVYSGKLVVYEETTGGMHWNSVNTYDEDGNLASSASNYYHVETGEIIDTDETVYSRYEFDSYGNWTNRLAKTTMKMTREHVYYRQEQRVFSYY